MNRKIFTVYDSKAETFGPMLHFSARGEALREFTNAANDPQSQIGRHPGDYSMFELGEYDDTTAVFHPHSSKINLGTAIEFKRAYTEINGPLPNVQNLFSEKSKKETKRSTKGAKK